MEPLHTGWPDWPYVIAGLALMGLLFVSAGYGVVGMIRLFRGFSLVRVVTLATAFLLALWLTIDVSQMEDSYSKLGPPVENGLAELVAGGMFFFLLFAGFGELVIFVLRSWWRVLQEPSDWQRIHHRSR